MSTIKAVTIKASETPTLEALAATVTETVTLGDGDGERLRGLQAAVGGIVDCFDIIHPETRAIASVWFHDEGKIIGLRGNHLAHLVAAAGGWPGVEFGDWIAGDVIVTGFDPASGETTDIPDEWVTLIDSVLDHANEVLEMIQAGRND